MSTVIVTYELARAARDAEFIRTGMLPNLVQRLDLDASSDLAEPERTGWAASRWLGLGSLPSWASTPLLAEVRVDPLMPSEPRIEGVPLVADHMLSLDEVRAHLRAVPEMIAAVQPALEAARAEAKAAAARYAAAKAAREAEAKGAESRAAAERESRAAEKAAWIAAHGSDYLQRAHGAGYDCQRRYVTERAAVELPGFDLDWEKQADWRDRACPSESSLKYALILRELGFNAQVVWLTDAVPPDGEREKFETFEPREAVVVTDYLGRYTLISTNRVRRAGTQRRSRNGE